MKFNKFILPVSLIAILGVGSCVTFANITELKTNVDTKISKIELNNYVPLIDTLESIGFDFVNENNNLLTFKKDTQILNFTNESNYNLKKNDNTYYCIMSNGKYYIKLSVLDDLGYNVIENGKYTYSGNKIIKLDIEDFKNNLIPPYSEKFSSLTSSKNKFYDRVIVKENLNSNELKDYSIEKVNLMNYSLNDLTTYIKANYNCTLEEYKENLISINEKYSDIQKVSYDLLDNGQIIAYVNGTNKSSRQKALFIETGIEIRNNTIFVEK